MFYVKQCDILANVPCSPFFKVCVGYTMFDHCIYILPFCFGSLNNTIQNHIACKSKNKSMSTKSIDVGVIHRDLLDCGG